MPSSPAILPGPFFASSVSGGTSIFALDVCCATSSKGFLIWSRDLYPVYLGAYAAAAAIAKGHSSMPRCRSQNAHSRGRIGRSGCCSPRPGTAGASIFATRSIPITVLPSAASSFSAFPVSLIRLCRGVARELQLTLIEIVTSIETAIVGVRSCTAVAAQATPLMRVVVLTAPVEGV